MNARRTKKAIRKYLAGRPITPLELAAINKAQRRGKVPRELRWPLFIRQLEHVCETVCKVFSRFGKTVEQLVDDVREAFKTTTNSDVIIIDEQEKVQTSA